MFITWIKQKDLMHLTLINLKIGLAMAGYQSCIIREPGGEVKRAYSCHDEPLGTIDEGFNLFKQAKKCITPTCVSSADSKIPKHRKKDFLEQVQSG